MHQLGSGPANCCWASSLAGLCRLPPARRRWMNGEGTAVETAGLRSWFSILGRPLPPVSLQGIPGIVQMPLALSLSSYSAFPTHLASCAQPSHPFASLVWTRQGRYRVGPRSPPSQPHCCCHRSPQLGPGGRGAEKAAPTQQGCGTWDPVCSFLPGSVTATSWAALRASEKARDEQGLSGCTCTICTWAPERLWA